MARVSKGQSLVEVVLAVGMISILLVALLSLVSLSLKNARLAKARTQAVALAQEGVELMRVYRDYDWSAMFAQANSNYNLPANWVVTDGLSEACQNVPSISLIFWRCVSLTTIDSNEISAVVSVGWNEGSREFTTTQTTQLSLWER